MTDDVKQAISVCSKRPKDGKFELGQAASILRAALMLADAYAALFDPTPLTQERVDACVIDAPVMTDDEGETWTVGNWQHAGPLTRGQLRLAGELFSFTIEEPADA